MCITLNQGNNYMCNTLNQGNNYMCIALNVNKGFLFYSIQFYSKAVSYYCNYYNAQMVLGRQYSISACAQVNFMLLAKFSSSASVK